MMDALSQSWMLLSAQLNWRSPAWLALIPVAVVVALLWQYRVKPTRNVLARVRRYADMDVWPLVVRGRADEDDKQSRIVRILKDLSGWLGLVLLLLALAGPRWQHEDETVFRQGADIAVVMDMSRSMRVGDGQPGSSGRGGGWMHEGRLAQKDRLTREKNELHDFLLRLQGDRVALVAFAGRAFMLSPLTPDYGVVMHLARQLSPDMITDQGSDLAAALRRARQALKPARGHGRAVVLLTDGENVNQGELKHVAASLVKANIPVFVLGIGTPEGGLVPAGDGRFVHDAAGRVAQSRLHEQRLMALAKATGGVYARMQPDDSDWDALYDSGIAQAVKRTRVASRQRLRWREAFAWALLPAMLLFGLWWKSRMRAWQT